MDSQSFRTVKPGSEGYPPLLLPLEGRPQSLYLDGVGLRTGERSIAVIGTRSMTSYGRNATRVFVSDLVREGFTIVSGLALGIDGEAHRIALEERGKTVAVIPSGLHVIAPAEHIPLARAIIQQGGGVYSEYPPGKKVQKYHFHQRNRLLAGMCMGVLVIEAGEKSGTSITVRHAADYGKPVFAVPGPFTNQFSEGTKEMVNMGAKLVTKVSDILEELGTPTGRMQLAQQPLFHEETTESHLYAVIQESGGVTINELLSRTSFSLIELQTALTRLEMRGVIRSKYGQYSSS